MTAEAYAKLTEDQRKKISIEEKLEILSNDQAEEK